MKTTTIRDGPNEKIDPVEWGFQGRDTKDKSKRNPEIKKPICGVSIDKNILVTGGCGFIGSNFIKYLLEKDSGYFITNFDIRNYAGKGENLKHMGIGDRCLFVEGDICDYDTIKKYVGYNDIIINFAAMSHVDRSIDDASDFAQTNFVGVQKILDAIVEDKGRKGKKRFLQVSTDEVYGSISDGKFKETDKLNPGNPYSATKAGADHLVLAYVKTFGIDAVITRSSNNFGSYQFPEKVIPLFVTNLLEGKKVPLYGDGADIRDWIYVEDNCEAIDLVLHKGKAGEIYNIGGGNEISNIELTKMILKLMDKDESFIEHVKDRPGHDFRYGLDCSKIKKELGWKPRFNFDDALKETVEWYEKNEGWWEGLKE